MVKRATAQRLLLTLAMVLLVGCFGRQLTSLAAATAAAPPDQAAEQAGPQQFPTLPRPATPPPPSVLPTAPAQPTATTTPAALDTRLYLPLSER